MNRSKATYEAMGAAVHEEYNGPEPKNEPTPGVLVDIPGMPTEVPEVDPASWLEVDTNRVEIHLRDRATVSACPVRTSMSAAEMITALQDAEVLIGRTWREIVRRLGA